MKKILTTLLLSVFGLILLSSCEDSTTGTGNLVNIDGYVINKDGQPVAGALIKAFNNEQTYAQDTSDEMGMFTLINVPEAAQDLKIAAISDNYSYFEIPYNNAKSLMEKGKMPILLEGQDTCCNVVKVIVKDDSTGTPISGAQVKLQKNQSDWKQIKETDSTGTVIFENVCDAKYWIRVAKDGFSVKEEDFTIDSCETKTLDPKLKRNVQDSCCNNSVKIWVKDTAGELIKNAKVRVWKNGQNITYKISENGYVIFNELCKGKYGFDIISETYKSIEFNYEFECGDSKELTKVLEKAEQDTCCNGKVKIWLKNASGDLLNNIKVKLWKGNQNLTYKISENGYVIFDGLCKGTYGFSIQGTDLYKGQEFNYELGCNETKEFTRELVKITQDTCCNNRIKLWVKNGEGGLINNAKVKLWKNGQNISSKISENGYVVFEGLCTGKYGFDITAETYKAIEFNYEFTCDNNKEETKILQRAEQDTCCDGKVKIQLKNSSGELLSNVKVKLWKNGQNITYKVSQNGYVIFEDLCKAKYGFSIQATDLYKGQEFDYELGCNETKEFTKVLENQVKDTCYTAVLKIIAKDYDSKAAIPGAKVVVKLGDSTVFEGTTNNEGYIAKEGLKAPAEYKVIVSKDGYQTTQFEMYFPSCKTLQETANLKKD